MLATVLNSKRALKASIAVIDAFVRLRHLLDANRDLAWRIDELNARFEKKTGDATTVEANAALRELQRKDTRERYGEYVKRLAEEAGEPAANAEDVARFDRKRKGRKCSNKEWEHPHDPDARVSRDKRYATDMLYKMEKADDLETGAIVSVTVQTADTGDTESIMETLSQAEVN